MLTFTSTQAYSMSAEPLTSQVQRKGSLSALFSDTSCSDLLYQSVVLQGRLHLHQCLHTPVRNCIR